MFRGSQKEPVVKCNPEQSGERELFYSIPAIYSTCKQAQFTRPQGSELTTTSGCYV